MGDWFKQLTDQIQYDRAMNGYTPRTIEDDDEDEDED